MKLSLRICGVLIVSLFLTACKTDLYSGLSQDEANQMSVVLLSQNIAVDKVESKNGTMTLTVEKSDFAAAVELLRLHGYPQKKYRNVEDLFPNDQLVTSPGQEKTKIIFLKEQSLERMLADMDGVVSARVVIAQPEDKDDGSPQESASVAAYIKYAPNEAVNNSVSQIKGLIHASVPMLSYDKISVVLQPTQYLTTMMPAAAPPLTVSGVLHEYGFMIIMAMLCAGWAGFGLYVVFNRFRRPKESKAEAIP
ncbi:type III secretion inner membrane ring lipoprotein SctJ [Enterobacter asburiae]|uniref:type III secretion system inner membrane ring lipoprotein SctJ n=1 Tax=Enterobacter asburiae TaxID=61645 RepID=UPI002002CAA1|nr:type III secretion inner membrane ring lipoprotein SctJ [Enterobacter asburiae]MCK7227228.1 type III secretion inner membrane ring lipoprotein SctJ [Enterobacter asburiae]